MSERRRRGFTLIELFVVLAIFGCLMGLLLPALSRVRSAVHRVSCAAKLRQVALAAHVYAHSHGSLPVGCRMPYARPAQPPSLADASGIPPPELLYDLTLTDSPARRNSDPIRYPWGPNWAVALLPYLEQLDLYAEARPEDYLVGYRSRNAALRDRWRTVVRDRVVGAYQCPADAGNARPFQGYQGSPGPWARGNYAANAGPGWWQMSLNGCSYNEAYGPTGPVFGINFGAVPHKIPDGTAGTVLFNEVRVGVNEADPRGVWAMGFAGSSVTAANAIGNCPTPNDGNEGSDDVQGCPDFHYPGIGTRDRIGCDVGLAGLGWPSWQAQARSRHPGGVNAAFVDGSVRFVGNDIRQAVWFRLLSANDGQSADLQGSLP